MLPSCACCVARTDLDRKGLPFFWSCTFFQLRRTDDPLCTDWDEFLASFGQPQAHAARDGLFRDLNEQGIDTFTMRIAHSPCPDADHEIMKAFENVRVSVVVGL